MGGWVLVADGEAEARMELFHLLERDGHHATVVESAPLALQLLQLEPFDLALVERAIAGIDGTGLVNEVRADPALEHLPLVVISAACDPIELTGVFEGGAQDYLLKPFHPLLVRSRVRAALAVRRLHDVQAEYERQVRCLTGAVAGVVGENFDRAELEQLARRSDACGGLARAVTRTIATVQRREQELRRELDALRSARLAD